MPFLCRQFLFVGNVQRRQALLPPLPHLFVLAGQGIVAGFGQLLEPEYNANSQIIFRDNNQGMIRGKHVLVLMASVTTGYTAKRAIQAITYYGGTVAGVAAIYSAVSEVEGYPVRSVYTIQDLPGYASYDYRECPYCKAGKKIDALVNSLIAAADRRRSCCPAPEPARPVPYPAGK